ncbi:CASP-like protein 1C3 [Hibiscus syriacus]|uniref:CASP-like protein n=1 Tax=Hibiscus syriacus TaxID=106335 RepID=A0A6A2XIY8_HIBSY|nr:CASP-like protein 1C3 [Hibiscus syriacus]
MAKTKRIITILIRFLALGATLSATVVMVTSHDSAEVLNIKFTAIASGYGLVALFLSRKSSVDRLIGIMNVLIAMLLTSSISAASAVAEIGKKGNSHAGWLPICDQVPKFCDMSQLAPL